LPARKLAQDTDHPHGVDQHEHCVPDGNALNAAEIRIQAQIGLGHHQQGEQHEGVADVDQIRDEHVGGL